MEKSGTVDIGRARSDVYPRSLSRPFCTKARAHTCKPDPQLRSDISAERGQTHSNTRPLVLFILTFAMCPDRFRCQEPVELIDEGWRLEHLRTRTRAYSASAGADGSRRVSSRNPIDGYEKISWRGSSGRLYCAIRRPEAEDPNEALRRIRRRARGGCY